ncbi:MAG TPA: OmpA family protein, partial [Bdellovibrionales bacterium]|nr:OmpA family protein [Bdellovibrionales bacterium]
ELAALDDSLKRNAGDLDRSRLDQDKWDLIRRNYEVLAINTQQEAQVGEARDLIAKAKARGARTYAPMALRQAEKDLAAADRAIATTPDDETAFTPAVNRANASARDLLTINAAARRAAGQTNEEVAVELEGRNRTIAGLRGELQGAELEAAVAGQALAGKDAQLRGVAAANRSLRSEQEWNDAIEQVRGEFSEDEADVYRQGDKLLIRLKKIGFATGSADVPEQSREILSKVGSVISELNAKNVEVQGHTDSTGGPAINQKISKERARAVAEYLEDDVDDINVKAVGYGFERPIVENKSKAGRATNRRVDVVIEPARK